jgi:hypothetical protein
MVSNGFRDVQGVVGLASAEHGLEIREPRPTNAKR